MLINMKNSDQPLYLSAREAAGELGVSTATLYAYVSRGLVRSEPVADTRARRYRADDVRALKVRRPGPAGGRAGEADAAVLDSAVSTITDAGPIYRGVPALALAEEGSLEQAATLLWGIDATDPFSSDNLPVVDEAMRIVRQAARMAGPLSRAIAVLALAGEADPRAFNRAPFGRARTGARVMRLVAASILDVEPSARPLHEQVAQALAPGDPRARDLLRRSLVLLADHELNASSFTVRCAVSTGIHLYDATIAGLAALKGPKHGGAGPLASLMVSELAAGDLGTGIRHRVSLGTPVPGFGHTIYRDGDPRADALLRALARAGADRRLAVEAPALLTEATGLYPNIDFALAVMVRTLKLPAGSETVLFAIARTAGWIAHAIEQLETETLIRPRARYVGRAPGRG